MELFDTLSAKKIQLKLNSKKELKMYVCGPTVYDYIHIGNARPLLLADLIIRFLNFSKIKVNYLLNITDIDDKIILKAQKENKTADEIATFFTEKFLENFAQLNLNRPTKILKVSKNINYFITYIEDLLKNHYAYESKGNVFFDTKKITDYGNLSKNITKNLITKMVYAGKKNNLDAALWKQTFTGHNWNSPWSAGRPGWHLECAALINLYFNSNVDIHIAGVDLKFPHNENERAIFMAKNNQEIAKIWVHNGHLNINNQKMSKSLNNTFYVKDFISKYNINTLKYIFYTKKYMQPLIIDNNIINFANGELKKISNLISKVETTLIENKLLIEEHDDPDFLFKLFMNELANNLNTANALEILKRIIKQINIGLRQNKINLTLYKSLLNCLNILGLEYQVSKYGYITNDVVVGNSDHKNKNNYKKNILTSDKNDD